MNTALLGTLRLSIIDNLRAEIREREGVIADLTKDEEPKGALLSPTRPMPVSGLIPFFHDESVNGLRPTHGDAIAKVRVTADRKAAIKKLRGKYKTTPEDLREPMIAFVKKNPGCKAEQIREAIGAKPTQMPTLRVLTSHAVKTKGAKRSTTYWPRGGK